MLTINALAACDSVIIPVTPEYLSAKGLELLLKNILRVKKKINSKIEIDGIVLTITVGELLKLPALLRKCKQNIHKSLLSIMSTK